MRGQSIVNVAGGGTDDGRPGPASGLYHPQSAILDQQGNVLFADFNNNRIRRISPSGILSTVVGTGQNGFSGDGGPATLAALNRPSAIAFDESGNLYIVDAFNERIRKVDAASATIVTIAGNGGAGYSGDGGPATAAMFNTPTDVAVDHLGNVYVADLRNRRVRRIDPNGVITTFAGNGESGFSGDGGPATQAAINVNSVTVDPAGNVYLSDGNANVIRRIDAASRVISKIAGTGVAGFNGDGIKAVDAQLNLPADVAVEVSGSLLVTERSGHRIRRIDGQGMISTVVARGVAGYEGDGGPATAALLNGPDSAVSDAAGNIVIADTSNHRIRRVDARSGLITTIAGNGTYGFAGGDGGPATATLLGYAAGLAIDVQGNLFVSDLGNDRVRRIDAATGIISTFAGNGVFAESSGDGGPATAAGIQSPGGLAFDSRGNLYVLEVDRNRIRRVDAQGIITTVAGNGTRGFSGDGGPATAASFAVSAPDVNGQFTGLAVNDKGDIFIPDQYNHRIRMVSAETGMITTVAGTGVAGFSGDGGPATDAQISFPRGVTVAGSELLIADTGNHRIRRMHMITGRITTVAGTSCCLGGDGGPATAARLNFPFATAVDNDGSIYIADTDNARLRKVSGSDSTIRTVAGSGIFSSYGDGGPAANAALGYVLNVVVDREGQPHLAAGNRVRAIYNCKPVTASRLEFPTPGAQVSGSATVLRWSRSPAAFQYDVLLDTKNPPELIIASNVVSRTFPATNLAAGTTYYWRIVAKGDGFCPTPATAASEVRSFVTRIDCTPQ